MRFIIAAVGVALISLAGKTTAVAETIFSNKETRQIAYKYGMCAVRHHAGGASKAVLRDVDSLTLATHYSALIDRDCVAPGGRLVFPGDFYVYALADALVARELSTTPVPDLFRVPPLEHRQTPNFADLKRKFGYDSALKMVSEAEVFGPISEYGECVVRESPADAKALLMTEPESLAETSRFEALQPAFSACAPKGKTMELSKFLLRGTIALNYYRLVQGVLHAPIH